MAAAAPPLSRTITGQNGEVRLTSPFRPSTSCHPHRMRFDGPTPLALPAFSGIAETTRKMSAFAESARKMAQFQKALAPSRALSRQLRAAASVTEEWTRKVQTFEKSLEGQRKALEGHLRIVEACRKMWADARARRDAERAREQALKPKPSTEIAIPRRRTLLRRIVATRAGPDDDHHAIAPHDLEQLAAPRRARRSVHHLAGRTSAVACAPRGRFHANAHPAAREGGACVGSHRRST